jgi:hypothetical protein
VTYKKILISLPDWVVDNLRMLKYEGYTISGYLRYLCEADIKTRIESGWIPGAGWKGEHWEENDTGPLIKRKEAKLAPKPRKANKAKK